jgi:hypothetical protein
MFFLIRLTFWLVVIFALVPVFFAGEDPKAQGTAAKFSAGDALSAATATMSDLSQFCNRRPDACAAGAQAAAAVGASAQQGIRILYGYLQDKTLDTDKAVAQQAAPAKHSKVQAPGKSGIDKSPTGTASIKPSQDTLVPIDLAPAWRGPA